MADEMTESGLQMSEQNSKEYVSEGLHDEELHNEIDSKFTGNNGIDREVPPLSLVNYLNVVMLIINLFFPVAFYGFDILGNSTRGAFQNKVIGSTAVEFNIIWILIFILQGMFVVVQMTPAFRSVPMVQMGVSYWYCSVTVFQTLWLILLPYVNDWALLAIFTLFWSSLAGLTVFQYYAPSDHPVLEYWMIKFPFETYFAWISVMLLEEISITLARQEFSDELVLAAAMVLFAVSFGGVVFLLFGVNRPFYMIPVVVGLAVASIGSELTNAEDNVKENNPAKAIAAVKYAAWFIGCLILILAIARGLAQLLFKWRANRKSEVDIARDNEVEEML